MTNYAHNVKDGGYLMIDHRASPGLPEDVALKMGLDPKFCGEGKMFEGATLTCSHCKCSVVKNPLRVRERAKCSKCGNHYVCDFCAADMLRADYTHLPFEAKVDIEKEMVLGSPQKLIMPDEPI
jgi:hypothetical protein